MERYTGKCGGGPLDGQMLTHWSRSKEFLRPMMPPIFCGDPPIIPVKIGEYRLDDFGRFNWHATEEGRAMEKLLGPAKA
jgi:hypothetical protein